MSPATHPDPEHPPTDGPPSGAPGGGGVRHPDHDRLLHELELTRQRAESILQASSDAYYRADAEGRVIDVNDAACRMLGYSREQYLGMRIRDFQALDDERTIRGRIAQVLGEGATRFLSQHRAADGRLVDVDVTITLVPGTQEMVSLCRDVTALLDAEARLRLQAAALDQIADRVTITDLEGRILYVNRAQAEALGVEPDRLKGQSTEAYSADPAGVADQRQILQETLRQGGWQGEVANRDAGGRICTVDLQTSIVRDGDGTPLALVGIGTDITERKRAERELQNLNRHLQAMGQCKRALLRAEDEGALLQEICRIAVNEGGYRLAWVGLAESDAGKSVRPVAQAGFEVGYLEGLPITWADNPLGQGPTGMAIRTGEPQVARDLQENPAYAPWREEAARRGYTATAALPLRVGGPIIGTLNVYSNQPNAFDATELAVLGELADNLGFGIGSLRTRRAREASEAALRDALERFRQISEAVDEWIWEVDRDGLYTYCSRGVQKILGYRPEEVVGRLHYFDLFPAGEREILKSAVFETMVRKEAIRDLPNTAVHRDGRLVLLQTTGLPVLGPEGQLLGYRGVDRDVTEQRQAEWQLRESERRFRGLFEHTPVAVMEQDFSQAAARFEALRARGVADLRAHLASHPEELRILAQATRVLEANGTAIALLGAGSREDAIRARNAWVMQGDLMPVLVEQLAQLYEGRLAVEQEFTLRPPGGSLRHFQRRLSVMPGHEADLARVMVSVTDLTGLKAAEAEQRRMEAELNHLHRLESLGRLAGGVAHDMNNLLGAIMGVASLLKTRHGGDPALVKDADTLLQAAVRGRDLVKGLRDFSRKELDDAAELDLNELARREADLLARTTLQKVAVGLKLEEGLPPVFGEASAIANALMNLCVNAVDAMPAGGRVTLETRSLPNGQVGLAVRDEGEGMPPEVLARALEPFFTTKPAGQGTGLGLSQVYGTMKAHGGHVDLQSRPGEGTCVTLVFPALHPDPARDPGTAEPQAPASRALAILLVDDDELIRMAVESMLEGAGHRVRSVGSGAEALADLSAGVPLDLVVMDINMPEMDGVETLVRLRGMRADLPVLMVSGFLDEGTAERIQVHARVALLRKPFVLAELLQGIAGLV